MSLIQRAFLDPIRTVLLIDDRFPTLSDAVLSLGEASSSSPGGDAQEWRRAAGLWRACRERSWACDTDNRQTWSDEDLHRICGSDLIALDYHLEGSESVPANASRTLLKKLAAFPHTNLVVVHTSRSDLNQVQLEVAASLRGVRDWKAELGERLLDFEDLNLEPPTQEQLWAILQNQADGKDDVFLADVNDLMEREDSIEEDFARKALRMNAERYLETLASGVALSLEDVPRALEAGLGNPRWLAWRNVFVVFVTKTAVEDHNAEAESLIDALRSALENWGPTPMRAATSVARSELRKLGLEAESLHTPDPLLEAGWWSYILGTPAGPKRVARARTIGNYLTSGILDAVASEMADFLREQVRDKSPGNVDKLHQLAADKAGLAPSNDLVVRVGHSVNTFLSCEPSLPVIMNCGSVFSCDGHYYICVSPACDMVPRKPRSEYAWLHQMDPWRPTIVLRLKVVNTEKRQRKRIKDAHRGQALFVLSEGQPLVLDVWDERRAVAHELVLVDTSASPQTAIRQVKLGPEGPVLKEQDIVFIAQLRTPYAENLLQWTGHHLSRIGTDFMGFPFKPSE